MPRIESPSMAFALSGSELSSRLGTITLEPPSPLSFTLGGNSTATSNVVADGDALVDAIVVDAVVLLVVSVDVVVDVVVVVEVVLEVVVIFVVVGPAVKEMNKKQIYFMMITATTIIINNTCQNCT